MTLIISQPVPFIFRCGVGFGGARCNVHVLVGKIVFLFLSIPGVPERITPVLLQYSDLYAKLFLFERGKSSLTFSVSFITAFDQIVKDIERKTLFLINIDK